jgi:hypothetical protein
LEAIRHVGGMIARAACPPIVPSDIKRRAAGNALMCLDLARHERSQRAAPAQSMVTLNFLNFGLG